MIPRTHPRFKSLSERHAIVKGVKLGLTHTQGLIAQGRGEAFDYLLGERTTPQARKAIRAAAAQLLLAKHPVISVNGNVAALCSDQVAELAKILNAEIEVNLFYHTPKRMKNIVSYFKRRHNASVLHTLRGGKRIPGLASKRGRVNENGIWKADAVLVPLEDGDRTEALRRMGKQVIAVELNPLSRTAQRASITIVDNLTRALPLLASDAKGMRKRNKTRLERIVRGFDNKKNLNKSLLIIRRGVR
ncbi:hypothetical protein DRN67_02945 [Candidatus Micrarchaeota archaeon]|nr:MAG: hypothetical protein DRN67_02945 [Candidatus Micrarchaeota archaeon]